MNMETRFNNMLGIGVPKTLLTIRFCFLAFAFWFTCDPNCETYVSPFAWIVLYSIWYLVL
jgi:hypothetical protein